ncbi:hypothetical protein AURDEDRAFT_174933 [Auricularia subglabra TFB-10046 SS5]|uniref:Uncharacterized protein n=1 Tax=Auricularia subglabra (strain TFB-10046 / SS5) TaxID=717982 RepID=J0D8V6_AURST|nr:hypothetical protein AURDEDRAFT_174933 [Auricularia subglabra TFB-10046 SS5]
MKISQATASSPFCAKDFFDKVPTPAKCSRLLGIANVCHQYDAMDVALWALNEALNMFQWPCIGTFRVPVDVTVARRLLNVAARWQDPAHALRIAKCRDIVCDALYPEGEGDFARDPIAAVSLARHDEFVLGHVYYYILRREGAKNYDWKADARLTPSDRRRLLCGSHALGRMRAKAPKTAPAPTPSPPTSSEPAHISIARVLRGMGIDSSLFPRIDSEIEHKRNDLWAMFDDASWSL